MTTYQQSDMIREAREILRTTEGFLAQAKSDPTATREEVTELENEVEELRVSLEELQLAAN